MAHKTKIGDSFYEVTGGKVKVGDSVYEIKGGKTKIGDSVYDISFTLAPESSDIWQMSGGGGTSIVAADISYINGYWVVVGMGNSSGRIAYATKLDGTWTTVDLWTGINSGVRSISYGNGYYVAVGYDGDNPSTGAIAYATSLSGPWTVTYPGTQYFSSVIYISEKNQWVAAGGAPPSYSGGIDVIFYCTNPTGTWSKVTNKLNCPIEDITYANGYYVAIGVGYTYIPAYGYGSHYMRCSYGTDLTGTWTGGNIVEQASNTSGTIYEINSIIYVNGYWIDVGYDRNRGASYVAYRTTLGGTRTVVEIFTGYTSQNYHSIKSIIYHDGYYIITGHRSESNSSKIAIMAYATTLDGPWTVVDLWSLPSSYGSAYGIATDGDYIAICGDQFVTDGSYTVARVEYSPTIEGFNEI